MNIEKIEVIIDAIEAADNIAKNRMHYPPRICRAAEQVVARYLEELLQVLSDVDRAVWSNGQRGYEKVSTSEFVFGRAGK